MPTPSRGWAFLFGARRTGRLRSETREPVTDDRYWRIQRALARRQIIPFLERAGTPPRGRELLDIGCGEGGVAAELAVAGARAHGLDLSEERIELGRSFARSARIAVDLEVGDGCDPSTASGPFDLVILR